MKIIIILIISLIFTPVVIFGQDKLVKDLDHDGVEDIVYFDSGQLAIVCKLSSQDFREIRSGKLSNSDDFVRINVTQSGFEFHEDWMRSGYTLQFRYNQTDQKIRLTGMSRYDLGQASGDGSGYSSVNLLTDKFIGEWNYLNGKRRTLIKLPVITSTMNFPKISLAECDGLAYSHFLDLASGLIRKKIAERLAHPPSSYQALTFGAPVNAYALSWKGTIAGDIPIFIHFQRYFGTYKGKKHIVMGAITYLNTQAQKSIKLIGYLYPDGKYYLREYIKDGSITGSFWGRIKGNHFTGKWHKPMSSNYLEMNLTKVDTLIYTLDITAEPNTIFGNYTYMYGKKGYQGWLKLHKMNAHQAGLDISSVTSAPGRNIAYVNDTIPIPQNTLIYQVRNSNCKAKIQFFKGFALVSYSEMTPCVTGIFGLNATIEGIFYKTK